MPTPHKSFHITFTVTLDGIAAKAEVTDAPEEFLGPETQTDPPEVPITADVVWRAISARSDQIAVAITERNTRVAGAFALWDIVRDRVDEDTAQAVWDEALVCGFLPVGSVPMSRDTTVYEAQRAIADDLVLYATDTICEDVAEQLRSYLTEQSLTGEEA